MNCCQPSSATSRIQRVALEHESVSLTELSRIHPISQDDSKPFAELWMGDHPSGPARVESPSNEKAMKKKSPKLGRTVQRCSKGLYRR